MAEVHINSEDRIGEITKGIMGPKSSQLSLIMEKPTSPQFEGNINDLQSPTEEEATPIIYQALYDFEGDINYKELSFKEGDLINITHVEFAEGWHLGEKDSEKGLVPIKFVQPFELSDESQQDLALEDAIPSQNNRNSIFGLRQLNRFSWFVTTGVEEFLLGIDDTPKKEPLPATCSSDETISPELDDVERHFIEDGPSWKEKTDLFLVNVHDPERRVSSENQQEYTVFQVTSSFAEGAQVTVDRRFSQFEWLLERLHAKFRALVLPPLPEKQFSGRFSDEFIEKRRRLLDRFMNRLARHPIIRYSEIFTHFLSCQSDTEWTKADKKFLTERNHNGFSFFQKVFHPEFNVEEDGDSELVEKFQNHLKSIEKLLPMCCDNMQGFRDHINESGHQYRKLSYNILRLITGLGETTPDCINEDKVWCFKDDCEDCLKLTKALQEMAEHMQSIANTYENYSNQQFSNSIELLREYQNIGTESSPLIEMHSGALTKHREVSAEDVQLPEGVTESDVEMVKSRCDTVFNVTLAEMNRIHDEKVRDFHTQSTDFLEQQIEFHEKVLEDLKRARDSLLDPKYSSYSQSPRELSHVKIEDIPAAPVSRPSSVTSVVGGVVDGVNSFLKNRARTSIARNSMFGDWMGWKSSGLSRSTSDQPESNRGDH